MAVAVAGTTIRIAQGDTGYVRFVAEQGEITDSDKGVFTLARRGGMPILRKILVHEEGDNAFHMMFAHEDTEKLKPDSYEWSFRVVSGGTFDADGKLIRTQSQHTPVFCGRLIIMAIAGGAR